MRGGLRKVGVSTPDDHATITIHYPDLEFSLWWISLSDIWMAETKLHKWHQAEAGSIFAILAGPRQWIQGTLVCPKMGQRRTKGRKEKVKEERKEGAMEGAMEKCTLW